eukprot:gene5243-biopygen10907
MRNPNQAESLDSTSGNPFEESTVAAARGGSREDFGGSRAGWGRRRRLRSSRRRYRLTKQSGLAAPPRPADAVRGGCAEGGAPSREGATGREDPPRVRSVGSCGGCRGVRGQIRSARSANGLAGGWPRVRSAHAGC